MPRLSRFITKSTTAIFALAVAMTGLKSAHAATSTATKAYTLREAAELPVGTVPASVPKDYMVTPMGYFPKECVHEIKRNEKLLNGSRVLRADGSIWQEPACQRPHYTRLGQRMDSKERAQHNSLSRDSQDKATPSSNGGYYAEVSYINNDVGTRKLTATWTVPAAPTNINGQVVFIFPGLVPQEDTDTDTIIQPVLSWANFGENTWQFVSWNCCSNDDSGLANYSTPIDVSVGDALYGEMSQNCAIGSSSCRSWNIISDDTTTQQNSTLVTGSNQVTPTRGQVYSWIVGAALEAYGVTSCDQFPASGSIELSNIQAYDANNNPVTPTWNATNASLVNSPACGYNTNWDATDNWIYW